MSSRFDVLYDGNNNGSQNSINNGRNEERDYTLNNLIISARVVDIILDDTNEYLFKEDAWVNKNHTRNETLKKEKKEDGIEDALSMNVSEIVSLATVIDSMMSFNRSRTGYLVSAKSKRKLTTTED